MTTPSEIFVTGPSRSGTTMMWSILNAHPRVGIAPETHYFDDLRVTFEDPSQPVPADRRVEVENYFLALSHRPFGHDGDPAQGWMNRDDLRAGAEAQGATPDAYFDAAMRLFSAREGGDIVGEKTPRHVFRIDEMLDVYPISRVIVLIRDPRAVVASYKDWRHDLDPEAAGHLADEVKRTRATYDPILLSVLWRAQAKAGLASVKTHGAGRVRLVRYEDLVADPEVSVRELCDWLEIDYHEEMLNVPLHNSSYQRDEPGRGVAKVAVERWRERLGPVDTALVEMATGSLLDEFGYQRSPDRPGVLALGGRLAGTPVRVFRSVAANRDRMGNPVGYIWRRARAVVRG